MVGQYEQAGSSPQEIRAEQSLLTQLHYSRAVAAQGVPERVGRVKGTGLTTRRKPRLQGICLRNLAGGDNGSPCKAQTLPTARNRS